MKKITLNILLVLISISAFSQDVDTINIISGKPYAFLINIAKYPEQIVGDNLEEEKNELKNNFKEQELEVVLIKKHCYLKFENGEGLDMTNLENSFTASVYWNGNNYDEVQLFDKITNTTEFIADKMGLEIKSSYAITSNSTKNEVNNFLNQNNITENSKITLKKYLQMYQNSALTINEEYWYMQEIPKIKNLKIIVVKNGVDEIYKNYDFNSQGQITYEAEGKSNGWRKYFYEDNMLVKIEKEDRNISINYDDNKMILSENVGDASETTIFWVEHNILLSKRYILMTDDAYANQNIIVEEKIEGNKIVKYSNGQLIEKNENTPYGIFPYVHTYTSYQSAAAGQSPEFMQLQKYKIEKKGSSIFEKYYSDAQKPNEKDNYKLNNTYQLNENNLIYKITSPKHTLKIEYSYYQ